MIYGVVMVSATHMHTYGSAIGIPMSPPSWTSLLPRTPPHPSRSSQSAGLRSLYHTASSHWLAVLHVAVYMFPSVYCLHSSHTFSPRLCAQVCSLCAMIFSCTLGCFPVCTAVSRLSHSPARSRRSCPGSVRAGIVFA